MRKIEDSEFYDLLVLAVEKEAFPSSTYIEKASALEALSRMRGCSLYDIKAAYDVGIYWGWSWLFGPMPENWDDLPNYIRPGEELRPNKADIMRPFMWFAEKRLGLR